MALTKDQKTAQVQDLVTKLKDAESVMFTHYIGLSVSDVSDLRRKIRESGAEMKVAKKTLMKLAFKEAGYPEIEAKEIDGAVACIFSFEDPLSGAQAAFTFAKDHDQVALVGGVFDGKLLTKEEAVELAKMPGRDQLLATFVGMLKSPMNSFAGMCSGPLGGFARALDQMAEKGGFVEDAKDAKDADDAKESEEKPTEQTEETTAETSSESSESSQDESKPEAADEAASDDTENEDSSESSESSDSSESSEEDKKNEEDAS